MDDHDLVILVPLWKRAGRFGDMLESARATAPHALLLLLCSPDDKAVLKAAGASGAAVLVTDWPGGTPGDYAKKMNLGYRSTIAPLLFLGADDISFHPGWLDACLQALGPGIGVVGTNDLGNPRVIAGAHSTHSLVLRWYVDAYGTADEPGQMLHEGYVHEFVDDELVGTAKFRGAYAHAHAAHVEHLHPHWQKAPMDESYALQADRMAASAEHFRQRQVLWA